MPLIPEFLLTTKFAKDTKAGSNLEPRTPGTCRSPLVARDLSVAEGVFSATAVRSIVALQSPGFVGLRQISLALSPAMARPRANFAGTAVRTCQPARPIHRASRAR